jgi:hypothetical protein
MTELQEDFNIESISSEHNASRFQYLLGLYDVSFIKPARQGDNPVGGKWTRKSGIAQKLLRTRRTFQHILPTNSTGCGTLRIQVSSGSRTVVGEAVNVVSLEALWGLLRMTVILRGDIVALNATERATGTVRPLSPLAVGALFDAPRIIVGRSGRFLNINIGPKSSVLLDTTYVDKDKVRIGMGGTSGTLFVFKRCDKDDSEANEFRALLARKPMKKSKVLSGLAAVAGVGVYSTVVGRLGAKIAGVSLSLVTTLMGALIAFSSGGIERDDRSAQMAKSQ